MVNPRFLKTRLIPPVLYSEINWANEYYRLAFMFILSTQHYLYVQAFIDMIRWLFLLVVELHRQLEEAIIIINIFFARPKILDWFEINFLLTVKTRLVIFKRFLTECSEILTNQVKAHFEQSAITNGRQQWAVYPTTITSNSRTTCACLKTS